MIKDYNIVAIRSDGEVFNYRDSEFELIEVSGIDFTEVEVFKSPRGIGHGDIITGIRKLSREITLQGVVKNHITGLYGNSRDKVIGFHNANYTYDLKLTYLGRTLYAKDCVIQHQNYPAERIGRNAIFNISFLSPCPDLFSAESSSVGFINSTPLWHNVRIYEKDKGLAFGKLDRLTTKIVQYLGSEETPVKIEINATGQVEGIIVGVNNISLKIDERLSNGDTLTVDAEKKIITKNGIKLSFKQYDLDKLMQFKLKYGQNVITVNSDSSIAFTTKVAYTGRYGGL